MAKFSRDKGARGERELLGLLREHLGDIVPRRNSASSRDGGHDTEMSAGWPWALEIKNCADLSVGLWWRQAQSQALTARFDDPDLLPALAYKITRRGWRFRMPVALAIGGSDWDRWIETDLDGFVLITRERLPQPAPAPSNLSAEELELMP